MQNNTAEALVGKNQVRSVSHDINGDVFFLGLLKYSANFILGSRFNQVVGGPAGAHGGIIAEHGPLVNAGFGHDILKC